MRIPTEALTTRPVRLDIAGVALNADLSLPADALGLVVFAHGSGSSRRSTRNRAVAEVLHHGIADRPGRDSSLRGTGSPRTSVSTRERLVRPAPALRLRRAEPPAGKPGPAKAPHNRSAVAHETPDEPRAVVLDHEDYRSLIQREVSA